MTQITFSEIRNRLAAVEPRRVEAAPGMREAAVSVVLSPGRDSPTGLLLIKRAEQPDDPWSGQMALPGGRRDEADRDLLDTAIRETEEETGILLARPALLGGLDDLGPVSPHLPKLLVRPFVFGLRDRPDVTLSQEATLYVWTSLEALGERRVNEAVTVREREFVVPGYRLGPHFVWGMTERILSGFLDRVFLR